MKLVVLHLVSVLTFLEAVPTDYVLETWSSDPLQGSCRIQSRLGLTKVEPKPTETEEATEDEELDKLFNSFWAVDHLPKSSPFVAVQKLPDVYIDENDVPCPINDAMTVERSEITEEAKGLRAPEFGEKHLYDAAMQPMDNIGKRNFQQYPNYMPYPRYPLDQYPSYDYVNYNDNNTQYPQEDMENCPDVPLKKEEPKINTTTSSEEIKSSPKEAEDTTPKPSKKIPDTTTPASGNDVRTTCTETSQKTESTEKVAVTSVPTEKTSTSGSENVMKISSSNKIEKKKKGKK